MINSSIEQGNDCGAAEDIFCKETPKFDLV
jgi:hypothetical protein